MNQCAYCRGTTRNISAGQAMFCNDQCHDAYFGITDNPFHTPEALAAAGYDPCMNCGELHMEESDLCPGCEGELPIEAFPDLNIEASIEQARKTSAPIDYDDIPF